MIKSECVGFWGNKLCQFEPRYNMSEPILPNGLKLDFFKADDWRRQTYICDVCVKCGRVVSQASSPSPQHSRGSSS